MSQFAILKTIRPGPWTEDGEITININHVAAIEQEPGGYSNCARLTLTGGRTVCVKGEPAAIRAAFVRQETGTKPEKHRSLFEEIFGEPYLKRGRT